MQHLRSFSVLLFIGIIAIGSVSVTIPARAETLVGSNVDNRITVALSVNQAAAQEWLPDPWQVDPAAKGPFKGANLLVIFIDRLLNQNAEGKPAGGGTFRVATLVVPAKHPQTGESAPFVTRVYGPHEGPGPYKNSVKATVRREAILIGSNTDPGVGSELWEVHYNGDEVLEFRMNYQRAVPSRMKREARPHSAVEPTFYRMYRYDQLLDVVESIPAGIDRVRNYQLRVTVSELAKLFDGSEQLVGIAVAPWYGRQTFLP